MNGPSLRCMNCGKACGSNAALYAQVFVCLTCHKMATSLEAGIQRELNGLMVVMRDRIREALVTGKCFYPEAKEAIAPSQKRDIVHALVDLMQKKGAAHEHSGDISDSVHTLQEDREH